MKRWAHGKQRVRAAFDGSEQIRNLAMEALCWCLQDRGISATEDVLQAARTESDKYPSITVKKFVDGYHNRRMREGLR
jgi:hypothetical protein